jgi:hypothetical protein
VTAGVPDRGHETKHSSGVLEEASEIVTLASLGMTTVSEEPGHALFHHHYVVLDAGAAGFLFQEL